MFNYNEIKDICAKYNPEIVSVEDIVYETTISYKNSSFFNRVKNLVNNDRRGEVVFCVIRPNKKIITVRSKDYPEGIFRIPTGGINYSENIVDAVYRETKEELGIETKIREFAGLLKINFVYQKQNTIFYSYIFILEETGGRLLEDAIDNEVSGIKEVDLNELEQLVNGLNSISGRWNDWGKFRYSTSNDVLKYLRYKHI